MLHRRGPDHHECSIVVAGSQPPGNRNAIRRTTGTTRTATQALTAEKPYPFTSCRPRRSPAGWQDQYRGGRRTASRTCPARRVRARRRREPRRGAGGDAPGAHRARHHARRPWRACHVTRTPRSVVTVMKIFNRHERLIAAPPERIAALVADFDRIWPARLAPVPTASAGDRRYDTGLMIWEEIDRPGAVRAFRVRQPRRAPGRSLVRADPAPQAARSCATRSKAPPPARTSRSGPSGSSPCTTGSSRPSWTTSRPG